MNLLVTNLDNSIIVGRNVREIRKNLNLTQEEFAEKLNINAQFLSQIETGKKNIYFEDAKKLCSVYGCSLSDVSEMIDKM